MKKKTYTKKMHIYRIKMMLKSPGYGNCPAGERFNIQWRMNQLIDRELNSLWANSPCEICRTCANIDDGCPCSVLGKKESIRRLNDENLQRKI